MIERKYKVAILNYPLMNPYIDIKNPVEYFRLNETATSSDAVPLYIHIPFCGKICKFCVYSRQFLGDNVNLLKEYIKSLKKEIKLLGDTPYVKSLKIGAIFFGGGTPTCLSSEDLEEIIKMCRNNLPLIPDVEITVECDVKNTPREKVHKMRELGVSRISTGAQTLNPYFRELLGLNSSTQEVLDWIEMAREYHFNVISIDLMYGLPEQSPAQWIEDIKTALLLPIDHFSIYELLILTGSRLYEEHRNNPKASFAEHELYNMYLEADRLLQNNGYQHHIIPEYNLQGKQSSFWELTYDGYGDNLSVGASSYGFINGINYQNTADVNQYIKLLKEDRLPLQMVSERATPQQIMERTVVLALRRKFIEKTKFSNVYGRKISDEFGEVLAELKEAGLLVEDSDNLLLTKRGEYLQGDISSMFMKSTFNNVSPFKKQLSIGNHIVPEAL
ncbi:coproporphyrinogen-III oxidase family protein [Alkaliphilus peptidifermentans]|uniref:Heme chaperone HemW n=1 Tax=Alkaliphilus peptidifermentans DSM 18978 TaxID=1120976 RepID=A0A1G5K5N6_9FIRM|nr:coproporphyrinogen-III oxidase family protein [Alkaliphilus peptidifermentans]SCY95985.1 oxygen-independent coproporphyrinogen-3 oxidase [Alkaliphilus peptidifermentans DSM 18978]